MPHIYFTRKGQSTFGKCRIMQLFGSEVLEVTLYSFEDFGDGTEPNARSRNIYSSPGFASSFTHASPALPAPGYAVSPSTDRAC